MTVNRSLNFVLASMLIACPLPVFAQSQNMQGAQSPNAPLRGGREAGRMVPATVAFTSTIESQKAQPGAPF